MLTSFFCSTGGETEGGGGCNGYTGSPTDVDIIDFWRLHMRQGILQRGGETLKRLRARRDGARLGQAHGHTERGAYGATSMGTDR